MSTMIKKSTEILSKTVASLGSLIKVCILSRRTKRCVKSDPNREIVVLGNGPSLRQTIADNRNFLVSRDRLAVNFAANTPEFFDLRPTSYVLADPHFFNSFATDVNVERLWQNLKSIDWDMTLFLPVTQKVFVQKMSLSDKIKVSYYNLTPIEGFRSVNRRIFNAGLGMPRPRNVLIPSIMLAIREGYGKIYVAGADHSWTQTLWVDERNRVVSVQPHFYEDNDAEKKRVATEYHNYPLHQILQSLYIAFRSYFDIANYAASRNVKIYNITPESFIDAFPRLKI